MLKPDNVLTAFYSHISEQHSNNCIEKEYFNDYENDVDGQLRSLSKHSLVDLDN